VEAVKRTSFADMHCSIAQTLEVVGEWWTLLILRDAVLGVTRFEDWQRRLGIARNVLSARLDALVEHGILERRRYEEHPPRDEYVLTPKGRDLTPVLEALRAWGDKHAAPDGPPVLMVHDDCGHAVHAVSHCSHCGKRLHRDHVHLEPGPGDPDVRFAPAFAPRGDASD
jgi:DNA-binding HxlR family transcriptional regulator